MNILVHSLLGLAVVAALLVVPAHLLGGWLHRVLTDEHDWAVERLTYRLVGVDPRAEQPWRAYLAAVLAFAVASVLLLWGLILVQGHLPYGLGRSMDWHTALNTAVSFTTNTNWQSYSGEDGAGYLVQAAGLTVQNFVSAATGIAVAGALLRALARSGADTVGNFWVDLTRTVFRVLLPVATLGALLLLLGGVVQTLQAPSEVTTLSGGTQVLQGGLVASQEAIKEVGTNGGGFFNANSAHPLENPTPWTNVLEICLILVIPFALTRTFGLMVGDARHGALLATVMGALLTCSVVVIGWAEMVSARGTAGGMEGKEVRFGVPWSVVFGAATTGTSTGAVNSMHDSYSAVGGGMLMLNMLLGELSPGGVGSGLYGMLVMLVVAVFLSGLMVGRTPELLGKSIGQKEITWAALSVLVVPTLVLGCSAVAVLVPGTGAALNNSGPHGLSEVLYAYASAANNNGSAFAGLTASDEWFTLSLAFCMLLGRFATIAVVLGLAGALAARTRRPATRGTLPTATPTFAVLLLAVTLLVAGLTYLPALALGPIGEALS
ncbi:MULTISPECIES: potassium-transporting ATPase subunit KdpA [Kytococcus]|uniref:Potassium-transporting ATPase potassium-binding subunit n=1 Tax=Kytococcus schroeteri TaxID=138300 RepID=A0A2I1PBV5_9MICO|nr:MULTISPECIES: potassium-transporting ATPase subunit KdpA [Kytococcus]OFS14453.1 potassium-transporting ATPase subunit KdpA [Kytococcus sp. HMSC28H12]PKZ42061.1 potassium-transporting ATPase subunit KdpA [Kytococcus schroeteri]